MVPCISSDSVSGLRRSDQSFHFFELLWHRTQCRCIPCFCLCLANLPTFEIPPCEKPRGCQIYGESRLLAPKEQSPQTWTAVRAQARTCRCLYIFTHLGDFITEILEGGKSQRCYGWRNQADKWRWLPEWAEGDVQSIHIDAMFVFETQSKVTLELDKTTKMKTKNETLRSSLVGVKGTVCGGDCRNKTIPEGPEFGFHPGKRYYSQKRRSQSESCCC